MHVGNAMMRMTAWITAMKRTVPLVSIRLLLPGMINCSSVIVC